MAFNFSAPTPAPAAGGSGFSFGGATTNATPTPSTSLFGKPASSNPTPASGGLFGAPAPAPSTAGGGLFGSTTAPAPSTGGLFGSTAAPKPASTGLFGSTPAPAPAGGLFGSTPAAAPAGGLFGSTTTTPAPSTGLFGSTTTPAPAAGSLFGAPAPTMQQQQQQQMQQQMQQSFNGNTPYSQLPDNAKRAIDQIYQLMMQHRRTLASVKTMAPSLLQSVDNNGSNNYTQSNTRSVSTPGENLSPADAAAGSPRRSITNQVTTADPSSEPLPQLITLQTQIQTLLQSAETNLNEAKQLKERAGEATVQAKMHGAWPIENVAARRGVALSSIKELVHSNNNATPSTSGGNTTSGTQASSINVSGMTNLDAIALQQIMDIRASHVDRIESMPSPYYWEVLHNFEQRVSMVQRDVEAVRSRLAIAEEAERVQAMGSSGIMRDETALLRANTEGSLASLVLYEGGSAPLSTKLATLARSQHDYFIRIAALAAQAHDGLEEAKHRYQRFCQTTKGGYYDDPFLKADIEEVSRERELQQRIMEERIATAPPPQAPPTAAPNQFAPSTSGGLFGAKAPAPSTGLFGSTAAPKPASGGLFGATPAAAAPAGGLFGATTAPKPATSGGLFGATPAAAPGGLFGSNPAPAPAAGGGLFGSTAPAPAPTTGLFGAPQPAAAPAFGAAPTTPASTLAPRKKSGSRSGGRRR